MEEHILERIIANAIGIGTIQTLAKHVLIDETVTEKQAYKLFGEHLV